MGKSLSRWKRQAGKVGMYGGPPLILLTVLNVYYGLGAGTPRSKFYLLPFLKDLSGDSIRQTTWGDVGIWSTQDSLLVLISLLGIICGTMFARRGGLMSLNDLLKLTPGKGSIKGGQTRTLRIGMEVKTPGGLTGVIEHINPERVRVRSGQVSVHLDKEELEASIKEKDN
jgi:hypothetical protein